MLIDVNAGLYQPGRIIEDQLQNAEGPFWNG